MVQEAQNLLSMLVLLPGIRTAEASCHATLHDIDDRHTRISSISVIDSQGQIICNSIQQQADVSVRDRDYFQQALKSPSGETFVSEVVNGRLTGHPTMMIARALRDTEDGPAVGALTVGLNLDWFPRLAEHLSRTPGTLTELVDLNSGIVMARSVNDTLAAAEMPADARLLAAFRARPGGGALETSLEGKAYSVGFVPLPSTNMRIMLVTALPNAEVLASTNRHLTINLLGFLGAGIAAVLLAWLAADRFFLKPIRQLAAAAAAIGTGNLLARVGRQPGAVQELNTLGAHFDLMAERLRARDENIVEMGRQIVRSEEHHRLLAENVCDIIVRFDRDFRRTYISPACLGITGYEPGTLIGTAMVDVVVEDDRARVKAELIRPLQEGNDAARSTYRATCKDGRVIWLQTTGRRLPEDAGFVTVARDVSIQKALEQQLEDANQQLRIQAMQDPLTGIANRRRFDEVFGFEFRRAQRLQEPLSVLMVDIDHFKSVNDKHGHLVGDECIRAVAAALDRVLRRPGDLVGRYGGEEFAILLPGTSKAGVHAVAERIRIAVAYTAMVGRAADVGPVTVSVGVATIIPPVGPCGPAILVEAADAALYEAKRAGRNCVKVARSNAPPAPGAIAQNQLAAPAR